MSTAPASSVPSPASPSLPADAIHDRFGWAVVWASGFRSAMPDEATARLVVALVNPSAPVALPEPPGPAPSVAESLEIQAGADVLLAPGRGGVALWVRRDELRPRVAFRYHGEAVPPEEHVLMLGAMKAGFEAACRSVRVQLGLPNDSRWPEAVESAAAQLRPRLAFVSNSFPSSPSPFGPRPAAF